MKYFTYLLVSTLLFQNCFAPPVKENKDDEKKEGTETESKEKGLEDYMEYHKYLKEVINALESDSEFRKKLEAADEETIKTGKIAEQLEFVSHHVRSKLDEIKRIELGRLKKLAEQQQKLLEHNEIDNTYNNHLDHSNLHTFEIEDLKKLIKKTTEDLAEADQKRREEFKQYELEKEYEKQMKLNHTNGEERAKLEKEFKEREEKHKKHEKLHEPGHKAQLEEVWEKQDEMQQEFDPRTFFLLHDLDGNGFWDQEEVKALFIKELQKMYQYGAPEDDMKERIEEMERMRESVFREIDTNRDGFIDYDEFLSQTKSPDFKQDHGWQGIDEQRPYTDEELQEYIRQHQANQIPQGYGYPDPNYHAPQPPQPHGGYQQPPLGYHPNAAPQFQPGQIPQNVPQSIPGHASQQNIPQGSYQHPQGYQQSSQYNQQPPQQYQPPPPQQYQQQYQQPQQQQQQTQQQPQQPNIPIQENNQQGNQPSQQQVINQQPPQTQQQMVNQQPPQTQQQNQKIPNNQQRQVNQQQINTGNQQINNNNVPQQNHVAPPV